VRFLGSPGLVHDFDFLEKVPPFLDAILEK